MLRQRFAGLAGSSGGFPLAGDDFPGPVCSGRTARVEPVLPQKGGAATAVLVNQCRGTTLVVPMNPPQDRLGMAFIPPRHFRGRLRLRHFIWREIPFSCPRVFGCGRQSPQHFRRLSPPVIIHPKSVFR